MKKMKRILTLILLLGVLFALAIPAFAEEEKESLQDALAYLEKNTIDNDRYEKKMPLLLEYFFEDPYAFMEEVISMETFEVGVVLRREIPPAAYNETVPGSKDTFPDVVFALVATNAIEGHFVNSLKDGIIEYWGIPCPEVDWASVDWVAYPVYNIHRSQEDSLYQWLKMEANLAQLLNFMRYDYGWYSEGLASILSDRFMEDPKGCIKAIAAEPREWQDHFVVDVVFGRNVPKAEFEAFMNKLVLDEEATTAEKSVLVRIVQYAEENEGMNITNPHTGDPVGIVVALLVASGLGCGVLLRKKKD